jgi:hypothetical protein
MRILTTAAVLLIALLLASGQGIALGKAPHDKEPKIKSTAEQSKTPTAKQSKMPTAEQSKMPTGEQSKMPVAGKVEPTLEEGRGRKDPFAPIEKNAGTKRPSDQATGGSNEASSPDRKPDRLHLEGILWSPRQPHVVINETLVGVGEIVAGWTVLSIGRENVVLENSGRKISLNMEEHEFGEKEENELPKE